MIPLLLVKRGDQIGRVSIGSCQVSPYSSYLGKLVSKHPNARRLFPTTRSINQSRVHITLVGLFMLSDSLCLYLKRRQASHEYASWSSTWGIVSEYAQLCVPKMSINKFHMILPSLRESKFSAPLRFQTALQGLRVGGQNEHSIA